jgi:hypothetical protein
MRASSASTSPSARVDLTTPQVWSTMIRTSVNRICRLWYVVLNKF